MARAGIIRCRQRRRVRTLDYPQRVKRVIFLFMNGGFSTIDAFDPKPALDKYDGKPMPGGSISTERRTGELMKSPYTFKKYGQCGMDVSDLVAAPFRSRRRYLLGPFGLHRNSQSRAVLPDDEHGREPGWPPVDGRVAHLRAWHRKPEPTGFRRALSRIFRLPLDRRSGATAFFRPSIRALTFRTKSRARAGWRRPPTDMPDGKPARQGQRRRRKPKKVVIEKNFDPKKILNLRQQSEVHSGRAAPGTGPTAEARKDSRAEDAGPIRRSKP